MATGVQLFVGLGNPGAQYAATRHNVGAWFVEKVASFYNAQLHLESKFHGFFAEVQIESINCKLLFPSTYMNCSGRAVQAITGFYKIPPANILVIHDELDFPPGVIRLKFGGGHNGHNGLRDIITTTQDNNFYRLRVGIGRPAHKDVISYVLEKPSKNDREKIFDAFDEVIALMPYFVKGEIDKAMQLLHSNIN